MVRPTKHQQRYKNVGRKPKIDANVLQKLEDAFSNSLPDTEACLYAGIVPETLYAYQRRNPQYAERKEQLKQTPNIAARKTIVEALKSNAGVAQWWLNKKHPDEFGDKQKIELSGHVKTEDVGMSEGVAKAVKGFEEQMRSVLTKKKDT